MTSEGRPERPGPFSWLWYAVGGGLPIRYSQWVLRDVTARWWRLRSLIRSMVQLLPVALVIWLVLPGEPWVRVMAILGGAAVGLIYAVAYLDEATESRALKAGFRRGVAQQVRDERLAATRGPAKAWYAERYRRDEPPVTPPPGPPSPG